MNSIKNYSHMNQQAPIQIKVASIVSKTLTLEKITLEEDLIESGKLDSLSLVQLMVALEDEFNLRIEPEEIDFADYRSVKSMAKMINRLLYLSTSSVTVSR